MRKSYLLPFYHVSLHLSLCIGKILAVAEHDTIADMNKEHMSLAQIYGLLFMFARHILELTCIDLSIHFFKHTLHRHIMARIFKYAAPG